MKTVLSILLVICFVNFGKTQDILSTQTMELGLDISKPFFNGFGASLEYFYNKRIGFELGYNYIKIDRIKPRFSIFSFSPTDQELKYDKQSVYLNYKVYSKRSTHNNGKFGGVYMKFKSSQSNQLVQNKKAYWSDFILGLNRGYKKVFNDHISFSLTIGVGLTLFSNSNTSQVTVDSPDDFPIEVFGMGQIGYRF